MWSPSMARLTGLKTSGSSTAEASCACGHGCREGAGRWVAVSGRQEGGGRTAQAAAACPPPVTDTLPHRAPCSRVLLP